ncbi:MAG TPA: PadR family transcriptional regulator [Verrucomicrobiae bacterium]|nr:PadR family transcriptional regulator [Verrucomicrobiae bacterium]
MSHEFIDSQVLELRRGTIVVATLSLLHSRHYGYGLLQALKEVGVPVDAGTLYPLLRRLEKQGVLQSVWEMADTRPRKYYWLSQEGEILYGKLVNEWSAMTGIMQKLLKERK